MGEGVKGKGGVGYSWSGKGEGEEKRKEKKEKGKNKNKNKNGERTPFLSSLSHSLAHSHCGCNDSTLQVYRDVTITLIEGGQSTDEKSKSKSETPHLQPMTPLVSTLALPIGCHYFKLN